MRAAAATAQRPGMQAEPIEVRSPSELEKAFSAMRRTRAGGILVVSGPMFNTAQLAAKNGLQTMSGFQVPAGHQPQDREGERPRDVAIPAAARG